MTSFMTLTGLRVEMQEHTRNDKFRRGVSGFRYWLLLPLYPIIVYEAIIRLSVCGFADWIRSHRGAL